MLAQQIAAWDLSIDDALPSRPGGLAIRIPIALGCSSMPTTRTGALASTEDRRARQLDIENRQLLAVRRRARAANAGLRELDAQLEALTARQQRVIRELQQQGYLRNRDAHRATRGPVAR